MTWNVVYEKTIAGTVSQEKIDELKKWVKENPSSREGIWSIQLTPESPDEEYAKYLFLQHEVIEEETINIELQEASIV